jgi:pyruvate,orthophosphate dikinase
MAYVFAFDHVHDHAPMEMKDLLGGKGANLAEMSSVLSLPVPPGFTITTDACRAYLAEGWPDGLQHEIDSHLAALETAMGKRLGDRDDPLLVSVRSGAKFSMPGMMDTVLDLGLNDESVKGLIEQTSDERFAYDSYRRFIQMYSRIVLDLPSHAVEAPFDEAKRRAGATSDAEIPADVLAGVVGDLQQVVERQTGAPFPQDPAHQLRGAVEAVFRSWQSPRAVAYRRREHIAADLGTAVNVQAMVFGNRDDTSGTGVGFTRNPATGDQGVYGDFLVNAQGEDVVAGIRKTLPLTDLQDLFPAVYDELLAIFARLEQHYRDMLDTEFTIEQGKLWMLQTRVGKRTGEAALRIAVALVDDPTIALTKREAIMRVQPEHVDQVLHPQLRRSDTPVLATGLAASPGAAVGKAYFDADRAADAVDRGEQVILVRAETSPEDVHGMAVSEGILTSRGGLVSHAAVVARGWGKPAVCGAESLHVGDDSFTTTDGAVVTEGDMLSIDGSTGNVYLGEVKLAEGELPAEFAVVLGWADEIRAGHLGVRANADTPEDAARAREFGAEGIGLCRTEHMFFGDRLPTVQQMIMAKTDEEEAAALAELLEVQRRDFIDLLEVMDGLPVTVRLLDPPLHEFLPPIEELLIKSAREELSDDEALLLETVRHLHEDNPMLGLRGVRLGIVKDGLYRMQTQALIEAVLARKDAGGEPIVEIMIPLVVTLAELQLARRWVNTAVAQALGDRAGDVSVQIGTMIETPRAALRGDDVAHAADFFSFGTNDLTQMTWGFSRDDVAPILDKYMDEGVLQNDPFETIDTFGVGQLVRMGVERGRATKPDLKIGVCGEHGGDPDSITFFSSLGIDYVSCSPFRVPVARLAAAQAVVQQEG